MQACNPAASTVQLCGFRWIVSSTPGDGSDSTGRLIAEQVSRGPGQPVVIDNKLIGPNIQAKTVAEFVALAKACSDKLNYASGGVGSSAHLSAELFKSLTGVEMVHISYKGSSSALAGVLSGEVSMMMIGNLPPWSAQIKANRVKARAVLAAKRHPGMPDVPALTESYPQVRHGCLVRCAGTSGHTVGYH